MIGGGFGWEAFDGFDEVVLGIEILGAAVGEQGVDEGVVHPGFEAAEEHPVFHSEFGGADHVLDEVGVDFQNALAEAVADFIPLVEGVAERLADVADGALLFIFTKDEAVEFVGDGEATGAPDQLAAGGRGCGLARLFLDPVDALDEEEDGQCDFGGSGAEVGELAPGVGAW